MGQTRDCSLGLVQHWQADAGQQPLCRYVAVFPAHGGQQGAFVVVDGGQRGVPALAGDGHPAARGGHDAGNTQARARSDHGQRTRGCRSGRATHRGQLGRPQAWQGQGQGLEIIEDQQFVQPQFAPRGLA